MVIRMIRITIRIAMFHVKQWENEWVRVAGDRIRIAQGIDLDRIRLDTNDSQIGMIRNWVLQCNNQTITMSYHYHFFTTFVCQSDKVG